MVKILVKNRLASLFGAMTGKGKRGTAKKPNIASFVGVGIIYLVLILCFAFISTTMAITLGAVFIPVGAAWLYFAIFMLASLSILFIFSIFETKSELFECKDNDLILSMPIKPRDIVVSRISVVLIYNYLEQAVVMIPAIVVYAIFARDVIGVIGSIIVSLFLPLVSTALASGVGYIVAWISKKFRKNSFITLILSLAFLFAYFLGYGKLMEGMDKIFEASGESLIISKEKVPLLYVIGSAALMKPLNLVILIAICLSVALLAYVIIAKNYIKIVTNNSHSKKAIYKGEGSVKKSALYALTAKELRRFGSSATYMLNGAIGIVFELAIGIIAIVKKDLLISSVDMLTLELPLSSEDLLSAISVCAILFMSSMSVMSASALSLEGKNLWLPKTLPVTDKEVLLSKVLPQLIITVPTTVITSVLLIIATEVSIKYWAFVILTPLFASIAFAVLGLVINVIFPKFDFENEAQPIKQSLAVFLVMMAQMLVAVAAFILNLVLSLKNLALVSMIITLGFFIALTIALFILLMGPCAKKYSKIEA